MVAALVVVVREGWWWCDDSRGDSTSVVGVVELGWQG